MSLSVYLSFILTCMAIELTPGPNMAYLAVISAKNGRKSGFAATAGIALGLFIVGITAALGVATLISNSHIAYQLLRWGGIAYLLWLAWEGWRGETVDVSDGDHEFTHLRRFFRRGLIVNLLNPKAAAFYIAVLPSFITLSESEISQSILFTVTYVFIATLIHVIIVTLAGSAQQFLNNQRYCEIVSRILSIALVGIAVWFAWETTGDLNS